MSQLLRTYVTGAAVGLNDKTLPGLVFNIRASYTGCMICGELFQSSLDRKLLRFTEQRNMKSPHRNGNRPKHTPYQKDLIDRTALAANTLRKEWASTHAKTHTEAQHHALRISGQFCTPQAAERLAPYGIFPLNSTNEELDDAMFEAPRAPLNDVEGT